jgi:hypothetical protein
VAALQRFIGGIACLAASGLKFHLLVRQAIGQEAETVRVVSSRVRGEKGTALIREKSDDCVKKRRFIWRDGFELCTINFL